MTTRWFLGLSCGAAAHGVDAALLEVDGVGLDLRARLTQTAHQPFGRDLRQMLRELSEPGKTEPRQLAVLHRVVGEACAAAARMAADRAGLSLSRVQSIGCPGFPFQHEAEGKFPSTVALGMSAVVAERTGVTTVSDFGARDLVMGGQAASVTALCDYLLFHSRDETRLVVDLGTVARVVYLLASDRPGEVLAFDAGPCGLLLDGLMRQVTGSREECDAGGKHAVQGRCIEPLLTRWLDHPFLLRHPPRGLPRLTFGPEFVRQAVEHAQRERWPLQDLLCTASHFAVQCILGGMQRFLPKGRPLDRILLSGRGVRNGLLWHLLEQHATGAALQKTDELGIPAEARDAACAALLAVLVLDGVPANIPAATGAAASRLLGSLTPGAPTNWARCLAWMAAQAAAAPAEAA